MPQARETLGKANQAREEKDLPLSLQLANEALDRFVDEKDFAGFAESLAAMSLTRRHQYTKTNYKGYITLALYEMQASVAIVEGLEDPTALAIPYYNLAKVFEELENWPEAIRFYKKAIDNMIKNPPPSHNRPGVVADFKVHLADAEFMNGDKTARDRHTQAIQELVNSGEKDVSDYNYNVWLSGAYMQEVRMWKDEDLTKAKEYLQKAKEIIDSDSRLTLRKEQWEKLSERLQ